MPRLMSILPTFFAVAAGSLPTLAQNSEQPLPIVRIAPAYPAEAIERRLIGHVLVEYTITQVGKVYDVVVIESTSDVLNDVVIESVQKYRYEPRLNALPGVRMKVRFESDARACESWDPRTEACFVY
jgi:periplasmic protein TonB